MARYHVNPRTGEPGPCRARVACPYGDLTKDHFDSKEDARAAYESGKLAETFTTLSKALDEVVDPHLATAEPHVLEDGRRVHTTAMTRAQLMPGDTMFDEKYGTFYKVKMEKGRKVLVPNPRRGYTIPADDTWGKFEALRVDRIEDAPVEEDSDELIASMERAGWPRFDPALGEDQFDSTGEYHAGGTDYPALTDEAMQEMDAASAKFREVRVYDDEDENGDTVYEVRVSEYGEFLTDDRDIVEAAERVAAAGEWGELEQWDEDPVVKLRYVARYMGKPNALEYISDAKLDNEDKLRELGVGGGLSMDSKRFRIRLDNALLDIAGNTIIAEEEARRGVKLFDSQGNPPF